MLSYYPKANPEYDNESISLKWEKIINIKDAVAKKLEIARANKEIGLSLEAKVTLYAEEDKEYEFLNNILERYGM